MRKGMLKKTYNKCIKGKLNFFAEKKWEFRLLFLFVLLCNAGTEAKNPDFNIGNPLGMDTQQPKQAVRITGVVTDEDGIPLPGAAVVLKSNKNTATTTDVNGKYVISPPDGGATLVFSFVGMSPQEVKMKQGVSVYNVKLLYASNVLEEIVVETGIFQRNKVSFTGATSSYKGTELKNVGNSNVIQGLKVLDPSFLVIDNLDLGSNPNALATIELRGQGSATLNAIKDEFSADPNQPLFVINGVESSLARVQDLDINRIESITILKDAGSTAIYGSKGANGVVVIETIKPKPGELKVYYNADLMLSVPDLSVFNMMNATEKLEFERLSGKYFVLQEGDYYAYYQKALDELYNYRLADIQRGVDTYWLSEPVQTGFTHGHSVRISGGNEELSIDAGAKYKNTVGVMKGSGRETWGGNIGLSYLSKKLKISDYLDVNGYTGTESPYGSFSTWVNTSPYFRKRNADGGVDKFLQTRWGLGSLGSLSPITGDIPNPLYNALLDSKNESNEIYVSNSLSIQYTPTEEIRLRGGLDLTNARNKTVQFTSPEHTKYANVSSYYQGEYYNKDSKSLAYKGYVDMSYATLIKDIHSITLFARSQLNQTQNDYISVTAEGFPYGSKGTPNLAHSYKEESKPGYYLSDRRSVGLMSAFNYNYKERYLFDFTYSLDGATTFGSNKLYKSFWSAGLGWNIDRETFMKDVKWIDILKLRASTGVTGNQNQGRAPSKSIYQYFLNSNYFGQGFYLSELANPNLPWQTAEDYSAGLDVRLLRGKYSMIFNIYQSKTDPNIIFVPQVPSTGVGSYPMDLGYLQKKGVELVLAASPIYNLKERIIWQIRLTAAYNKSEYGGLGKSLDAFNETQRKSNTMQQYVDGYSPTNIWAVRSYGIDPATGEEVYSKKNGELTMEYDADDMVVVGNGRPDVFGVISANFQYKRFNIGMAFSYSVGADIYNTALYNKVENITKSALERNQDKRALYDRWQKPGDITAFKSIKIVETVSPRTSRFVQKNDYLRAESINCSYELNDNKELKRLFGIQYVKITGYLNDIFRLETSKTERGTDYPFARSVSVGVNVSF
ncbi:TonB-dependent receptor SusC [termite gut metagenome]|uniref:TonB-dependent receptor SusC n=1 Tax=termite gut metagenome TaxID=433724 RepID=A0A5J4RB19_9ZZZZ